MTSHPFWISGTYRISWLQEVSIAPTWWQRLTSRIFTVKERVSLDFYVDQELGIHPIASPHVFSVQLEMLDGYEVVGMEWDGNENKVIA